MAQNSKIEWTETTWNPIRGCSVVSPGCKNCYAMKQAHRFSGKGQPYEGLTQLTSNGPVWTGNVKFVEELLTEPLRWHKPRRVFVNSMSDLFHDALTFEEIDRVFAVMAIALQHTFQILTKRPERMYQYLTNRALKADYWKRAVPTGWALEWKGVSLVQFPLPNVWLGVSCENQKAANERIPLLLQTAAAVRWVSAEPLLGPVDLEPYLYPDLASYNGITGDCECDPALDWVVCGGESGPGARPMDEAWVHSIVRQCRAAKVPVFVKQLGAVPMEPEADWRGRVSSRLLSAKNHKRVPEGFVPLKYQDKKGGDINEWPEDLRIRQYPGGQP